MGNTVSASSPAEVRSIEAYLSENCENVESLGSTRFMKVAKARGDNGYLKVYKVFINQDEALSQEDLAKFQETLLQTGKILSKESNCLPVRIVLNKGKDSILLVRSYQKYTLFDRLSTRPFINEQERIWYIYQLFKSLDQCQRADIRHGDLKSQNVLLSSANWLQLTDFASFKPTFIQHDNPSHFTFFFDTSRRQTCHLAPERFLSSTEFENSFKEKGNSWLFGGLTHTMDMFAAGCVVYEILCEGKAPFSYGQLCDYRNMSPAEAASHLEKLLSDIPVRFHVLLKLLLNRDPSFRLSAKSALKGDAFSFPPVLEWYYKYVEGLRPIESIEETVNLKYEHEPNVFWSASHDSDYIVAKLITDEETVFDHLKKTEDSRQFAVLVISLITSNIRSLKGAQAKVDALRLLVKLSYLCDCTIALERILPYFVFMLSDQQVTVRVYAIHAIVDLIEPLEPSNVEQSLIFTDYLLPEFMDLLEKKNPPMFVVQTLAANLGYFAKCAHRFHTVGWGLRSNQDDECSGAENLGQVRNRKEEMEALGKSIADLFTTLTTSENITRHCLINTSSLAALFNFFSLIENKDDNNILIRHMITFLNSKVDWRLRTAVFDALPICLQKRTVDIRSLLQQGLHDFEELVVVHVLHCIHSLIATDLLDRHAVSELLKDVAPFLAHPNKWIRVCVINILVLLDSKWLLADVHSKLLVEIAGYLKMPLLRLNSKMVILRNLKEPIPRSLWKHLMNDLNDEHMKYFVDRLQRAVKDGGPVQISEPWYRRIGKIGEDDAELKWKLLKFENHFIKMAEFRKSAGMESELTMRKGKIDLTVHPLVKRNDHEYGRRTLPTSSIDTGCSLNNQEWNEMFSKPGDSPLTETPVSTNHVSRSTCGSQLQRLLSHKESLYMKGKGAHPELVGFTEIRPSTTSKVHGVMLTHLHEHTDKIVKIATSPEHLRIVTVSVDGSIKVWNERALIGECLGAVRSDFTFYPGHDEKHRVPLRAGDWMNKGQYFAAATARGELVIMDLSAPNEKIVSKIQLPKEDGPIEEVHTDNNIAFVRSHHGTIYCLDRRVGRTVGPLGKHEVWSRTVHNGHGLVASSCVDPWKSNWMVMAVTNGQMLLWDLRYQQEVNCWSAKKDSGVPVRLWSNPCSPYNDPQLFASSNIMGDVGIYDVARGNKSRVLWSSLHTPLTYKGERGDLSDALVTGALCVNQATGEVFTGDSQGALRKWNLKKPHISEYLSGNRKFQGNQKIGYQDVIVKDGDEEMPVIREYRSVASADELSPSSVSADVKGSTCHRTSITDIACLNKDLLASASAEGVLKIWK